jgi:hypothetical protein
VQELNVFEGLLAHASEQLARGRIVLVELDAFHLPDTAGVSYRTLHTKSTIGIETLDREARRLGYFHNAGYFQLEGDDFAGLFGLDRPHRPDELVPYTEFAKFRAGAAGSREELHARALGQLGRQLARLPTENPVVPFRARFQRDVAALRERGPEAFHSYAFATLRQCGAAYELAASYLGWLSQGGEGGLAPAQAAFSTLSGQAKTLQFKAARAVMLRRDVDFAPMLDAMECAWQSGTQLLLARYGR